VRSTENIEKLVKNLDLGIDTNAQTDQTVLNELLEVQKQSMKQDSAIAVPNIGRFIMKSPFTKLAAAAVIIIAVTLGLFEFSGTGTTSGVVWGEVLEMAEQVPAVVFDMTVEISGPEGKKLVLPSRNYVAGDYGTRTDMYIDGKLSKIGYRLPTQKVAYVVRVDQKEYWRYELSDEGAAQGQDPDDPRTWLKMILSGGGYTELGRAEINGVAVEGIEGNRTEKTGENCIMRVWVDVKTNLPVQIVMETLGKEGGQMRPHKFVMENFEWNASLDESIFEPNIPDDYIMGEDPRAGRDQQENSKTQETPPRNLTEQEQAAQSKVKEMVRKFFNAFTVQDWDTVSKYCPYIKIDQRIKDYIGNIELISIGEPFKSGNYSGWFVPYEIKFKNGGSQKNTIRLKADENTGQLIVLGGF